MKTLADRLRWILAARKISARELARRASMKAETHVTLAINEEFELKVPALRAIATAAEVNFEWLATGNGEPEGGAVLSPRDAGRAFFLSDIDYEKDALRIAQAHEFLGEFDRSAFAEMADASPQRWVDKYTEGFRAWRRSQKSGGAPVGGEPIQNGQDEGPPIARGKRTKKG